MKSKFIIVCIAFLSLANAQKEEYRHTRFRVYLHPISTFLYTSPKVFYGSWAFEFYPTWALVGQVGHESGEYIRERMLVSGEDFTIKKNKMNEVKVGLQKALTLTNRKKGTTNVDLILALELGRTYKSFVWSDVGYDKTNSFHYDGWSGHASIGFSFGISHFNFYSSLGIIGYSEKRTSASGMYWDSLPLIDINIGIGAGI